MRKKLRYLTLLLLKDDIQAFEDAIRNASSLERFELKADLPFDGIVYLRTSDYRRPPWVPFVELGTAEGLGVLSSLSSSAVLFLSAANRKFAFVFGVGGRGMLRRDVIEPDFGLKVALNAVDPGRLRSIDVHTIEELTVHTRRQVSRASALDTFGIDVSRDLLRSVTGEPRDLEVAKRVSGADALALAAYVEFPQLGEKCQHLLDLHGAEDYKQHFAWIDHLRSVGDPDVIGDLDRALRSATAQSRSAQPHLAPPEPLDWERVEGFTFSTESDSQDKHPDLELDDYLLGLADPDDLSVERMREDRVLVWRTDAAQPVEEWPVYDCLVFEAELNDRLYVLTRGRWFQVALEFAQEVKSRVGQLPQASVVLPDARSKENEGDYNARVAQSAGYVLMDRERLRASGAASDIEFCDLMTDSGHLIHVKRWSRSATLSHLFAQGTVSAETLLRDASFRNAVRAVIGASRPDLTDLISVSRPDPARFEVVYSVIGKPEGPERLPFFSQLALMQAADRLQLLGFRVSTRFVAAGPAAYHSYSYVREEAAR